MRDSRAYTDVPDDMSLSRACRSMSLSLRDFGYSEARGVCERTKYSAVVDGTRSLCTYSWEEYLEILDRYEETGDAEIHSHWHSRWTLKKGVDVDVQVSLKRNPPVLVITVGSSDDAVVDSLHERLRECFRATVPFQISPANAPKRKPKKTVFLAHRFDAHGKAAAAAIRKLLSACSFSVVEGVGYEARSIPAKVEERIDGQDILLAVVTPGDSTWIATEAAYAHGRNKYVVFLVEEGTEVKKGILGSDYEHLPFPPGNIEKAFTDLLSALS